MRSQYVNDHLVTQKCHNYSNAIKTIIPRNSVLFYSFEYLKMWFLRVYCSLARRFIFKLHFFPVWGDERPCRKTVIPSRFSRALIHSDESPEPESPKIFPPPIAEANALDRNSRRVRPARNYLAI